ncbi:ATP-binding cassette domain-containing protein [Bengtsoniella intestinalis]|uniref:ABC transporter ATP-binding protein n=1 Tax=Bengtsoniella intestinalis TaxID=3073143 RepID=UPI00391F49F3
MLKLNNLRKTFNAGTPSAHTALDGLNLRVNAGDFVTIIGSNGAGKSTLFNAIGGSFTLDRGNVTLDGKNITFMKEFRRAAFIGRLFQDPMRGTAPDMTIEENLALAYSRRHHGPLRIGVQRKDAAYFKEQLAIFDMGLENRLKTKVGTLSGGQRQAMSLLMSTIAQPKLLLLDEHTAALDPAAAEKIMDITKTIQSRDNLTTLMITHNIQAALTTGNRTIMLQNGKVILDLSGSEREKMTIPQLMELYAQHGAILDDDRMLLS